MSKSTRSSSQLLPQIFQTEKNKRFINSTLDQLIEPSVLDQLNGFIGQKYRQSYNTTEQYLSESTEQRQSYQLEPTVTYKSDGNTIDFASQYIDAVNEIESQGGSNAKHDRLWEQESYAYAPPIDPDKFVNYRQYYWISEGLTPISLLLSSGTKTTIGVTNNSFGAYVFSNKNGQNNPDIIVYKGSTYEFEVDAPGHPFYIKTQYATGTDYQFSNDHVSNNGATSGTVTLKVPASDSSTNAETVLFYQCGNHTAMRGRIIIKDLDDVLFDPAENIIGCKKFTDASGLELTDTINVQITSSSVANYQDKKYFISGVGESITFTDISQHEVVEAYGVEKGEVWDRDGTEGFDTVGFDNSTAQSSSPDYWTIDRSSADLNAWSRANRWVHTQAIQKTESKLNVTIGLPENARAKRPIIEFVPNLELFSHGTTGRLIDIIDSSNTDAFSNVSGAGAYVADGSQLRQNDLICFTADPNTVNKIYRVDFVSVFGLADDSSSVAQVIRLVEHETFTDAQSVTVVSRRGDNKGQPYHIENGAWKKSQQKTKLNQKPLFNVYDTDGNSLGDADVYLSSSFIGSTLFEIATDDTQGTPDTVYGTNVIYERLGLINDLRANDTFNSGTFDYVTEGAIVTKNLRQYFYRIFNSTLNNYEYTNNWKKFIVKNSQKIIRVYESDQDQQYFEIDQYLNPTALSDLTVQVLLNGATTNDYQLTPINDHYYVQTTSIIASGNVITIKAHSLTGTPSGNGFFEVPLGLQRNSQNKNIKKLTLGDMVKHYNLAVNEHPNFVGTAIGGNNSRDLDNVFAYGSLIMQHSGNDSLSHILVKDKSINLIGAMRHSSREYEKFKQSLVDRVRQVSLDGTIAQNFDELIKLINKNKNSTMPFYDTDMLAYGDDQVTLSYTVTDPAIVNYPISASHNLTTLGNKSVYVYLNDVQLTHLADYQFTDTADSAAQNGVEVMTALATNDVIKIVEYTSSDGCFIPATPTKLGLASAWRPEKFTDDTYQPTDSSSEVTGVDVIRGHDGSITVAYGDFRDDIILEFEKRIYNNIKIKFDEEIINLDYGFFRDNEYSSQEILNLLSRDFYNWTGTNGVDYTTNTTYSASNDFTWNYSNYKNKIDQTSLPGYWRAIYRQWFDTDAPHKRPWESLGFTIKPDYWDTRYGTAPYTRGNLVLWNDIANGFIAEGNRKGFYPRYAKGSNFLNVLPVTESGELASPGNAGIINNNTSIPSALKQNWQYGDGGPPETAWRKSSSYRFAEQIAKFLAKPSRYAGLFFDRSRINKNIIGQYVYNSLHRQQVTDYVLPTGAFFTAGYINTVSDYLKSLGYTASTYLADRLDNISIQLSYKLGGFTNKDNMQVAVGSVSPQSTSRGVFLPQQDFSILLYKSAPLVNANYSGVIIQKTDTGYKVSGYANFNRTFTYRKPRQFNDSILIRVGAVTDSFVEWQGGGFYSKGTIAKNQGVFYRAKNAVSSSESFNTDDWAEIGNTLPLKGGVSVKKYKNYNPVTTTIPYGYEFKDVQEVADFLFGYDQYLQEIGFVFDEYINELNQPANWELSAKEFLFWTTQNWNIGSVISLSPAASTLKFQKENTIGDDLTDSDHFYSVLQQDGLPINPNNFATKRQDGIFQLITNPAEDGIYNADIRAVQKEHLLLLENVSQFNDVIFDDIIGNRQDRVKLVGFRTANWNGDLYAPGYILDQGKVADWTPYTDLRIGTNITHQGKYYVVTTNHTTTDNFESRYFTQRASAPVGAMLPNWDSKAEAFKDFYSLDSDNFDAEQQRYAQHLIGYEPRTYFQDLGLNELTQFKFYQGMLKEKGTIGPIEKFKSQPQSGQTSAYNIFEEYAFRVGEYGGHRTDQAFAFVISEKQHDHNRMIYQITEGANADTDTILNVNKNTDLFLKPYAFSGDVFGTIDYTATQNSAENIFKYNMAGYVLPSQVDFTVYNESDLLALDVTAFAEGTTVWIANTNANDWDVKRFSSSNLSTIIYKQFDDVLQITTDGPHGLFTDDYVVITNTNETINGVYKVNLDDSTDDQKTFSVDFAGDFDSTNTIGTIGVLKTIRINTMDDLDSIIPDKGFVIGDYVYVDNNYTLSQPNNGLWQVLQKSTDTSYTNSTVSFDTEYESDAEIGTSVVVDVDNLVLATGASGVNKVFIYIRNQVAEDFYLRNEIELDIANPLGGDKFGQSLASTKTGNRLFAGSPETNDIVRLTLDTTDVQLTRAVTITGGTSGATGKILEVDHNDNVYWVKVTSVANFENEPVSVGDSSSVVSITAVLGTDNTKTGAVHWINQDVNTSFSIKQSIVAPDVNAGGEFGASVAVSGDGTYLAVGAPGGPNDSSAEGRGTVYIYKYAKDGSSTRYDIHQTLVPTNSQLGARFGTDVKFAEDGSALIVTSAQYDNDSTTTDNGRATVYRFKNDAYYEHETLVPQTFDAIEFGTSVAIDSDGSDVVIGAPLYTDTVSTQGGVFHYSLKTSTLQGDGSTTAFESGFAINMSDAVGVFVDDENIAFTNDGSSTPYYILDGSSTGITFSTAPASGSQITISQYQLVETLVSRAPSVNQGFGNTVSIDDNTLIVQSKQGDSKRLTTFDSISTDGSTVLLETTFDNNATKFNDISYDSGQVSVFVKLNTEFQFVQNLTSPVALKSGANFGSSIAISNLSVYVGAKNNDTTFNNLFAGLQSFSNSGQLLTFNKPTTGLGWNNVIEQPNLVDTQKLKSAFTYNIATGTVVNFLSIIDPAKGKLFPQVQEHIKYQVPFDPADYALWDEDHVGEIWLDVSTFKYMWYEQGSLDERLINWGKLHPDSNVEARQWVASSLTPTQYNALTGTNQGDSQGITGTANSKFVTKRVFDDNRSIFVNRYFYWVTNSTTVATGDSVSASQIASSIADPATFTNNFIAMVSNESILLNLDRTQLEENKIGLHFENTTDSDQLQKHTEYALVSKNDPNSAIPQQLVDKFFDSLVGFNTNGKPVPDMTQPEGLRYGSLDRPRQSWYKDKLNALKVIVKFINSKLLLKAYAVEKNLTKFLEFTPLPSAVLGEFDRSVDTEIDLTYIDTDLLDVGYKVLVFTDSDTVDGWAVYTWNGETWIRSSQQTYDTTNYWSYSDWHATGYDKNTVADYVVADERTRLNSTYNKGDIVKVRKSYGGESRFYVKTSASFNTIIIENGTLQLSTRLYDYANNAVGFGATAYASGLYDAEAITELRNILEGVKSWSVDEDANLFNEIFFLGVRIAQVEQKDIDWTFKTSFVKLLNTYSDLEQLREFQIDASASVSEFFREVLPFKTTVREDVTSYKNQDIMQGDITDFDNKSYYDKTIGQYITPALSIDDSTYFDVYDTNPWKQYSDNFKYNIGAIEVGNGGEGYTEAPRITISGGGGSGATAKAIIGDAKVTKITVTNKGSGYTSTPTITVTGGGGSAVTKTATVFAVLENTKVRNIDTTVKFDRINTLKTITNTVILNWTANTSYTAGQNVRYLNEIYRVTNDFTSNSTFISNVTLNDSSSVVSTAPLVRWTATDRIHAYYRPTTGMAGLIGDGSTTINTYAQLMTGIEYLGVKVQSNAFQSASGYDEISFDNNQYDVQTATDDATVGNLDQILDSRTFTTQLGQRAEDINVVGDAFISEYSAHAPEEVIPGGVYDTMDLKVFTRQTDGTSLIVKRAYFGDGSTTVFDTPDLGTSDGLRVFVNNIFKNKDVDYTVNFKTKEITFTTAPAVDAVIGLQAIQVATENLIGKFTFEGGDSVSTFNIPVTFDLITQTYVLVNGEKQTASISVNSDGGTDVTIQDAPDNAHIEIFVFDLATSTKAFSEVVTTEYADIPGFINNAEIEIQIDPANLVLGPHHHKVIVEGVASGTGTNRYRLDPPQVSYFVGDGSTLSFDIPNFPEPSADATIATVEVWKNGIILQAGQDFFLSTTLAGFRAITLDGPLTADDTLAVVYKRNHDYELDAQGVLKIQPGAFGDSSIDNSRIFVTTFANSDQQQIRTQVLAKTAGLNTVSGAVLPEIDRGDLGVSVVNNIDDRGDLTTASASLNFGTLGASVTGTNDAGAITGNIFSTTAVNNVTVTQDFGDLGIQTASPEDFGFLGAAVLLPDIQTTRFQLATVPSNPDFTMVSINKQYVQSNFDYRLNGSILEFANRNFQDSDIITVTYFGGAPVNPSIGYRVFKDIINRYHYKRVAEKHSTKLTTAITKDSVEITVNDATVLGNPSPTTNTPGVVFIGTERIAFFEKDGNTLKRLYRGTLGTAVQSHATGLPVVDASAIQNIPYEDTTTTTKFTGDGSTLVFALDYVPSSANELTVFVGGETVSGYTVGSDSSTALTLSSAPASGVEIRVIRKVGSVWYDQGTSTASNGLGLQSATGVQVEFLQKGSSSLNLIVN